MAHKILIAEEDPATLAFLADNLTADGFEVYTADSLAQAKARLVSACPDAIVADLNGSTLQLIDEAGCEYRMLVFGSATDELDRVRKLERGPDVMTKPFSYPELRARLTRLVRPGGHRRTLSIPGGLRIDVPARRVTVDDVEVELSQKEFLLLSAMAAEPTRVFTKDELLRDVWGYQSRGTTRTLDSHVCRVRRKLNDASTTEAQFFTNVWGVGYRLIASVSA